MAPPSKVRGGSKSVCFSRTFAAAEWTVFCFNFNSASKLRYRMTLMINDNVCKPTVPHQCEVFCDVSQCTIATRSHEIRGCRMHAITAAAGVEKVQLFSHHAMIYSKKRKRHTRQLKKNTGKQLQAVNSKNVISGVARIWCDGARNKKKII